MRGVPAAALPCLLTLLLASGAGAVTFVEAGDAPDSIPGQDTSTGIEPLTEIVGSFASVADIDIYRIRIEEPGSFIAATSGADELDSMLWLFDANGLGVAANDDRDFAGPVGEFWSDLSGLSGIEVGTYHLAISRWCHIPFSASGSIFRASMPGDESECIEPDTGLVGPIGPGAGDPLSSWVAGDTDALLAQYTISLTGASTIPEPTTALLLTIGLAGLAVRRRGLR